MKKIIFSFFMAAAVCLSGCAAFDSGMTEYTLPDEEPGEREVEESSIDTLSDQYHAKATLDPGFLAGKGYNASTFSVQAADTQAGIAQAKANYAIAEAKYSFWSAVIDDIDVNALSEEFYNTANSLDTLLYAIADAKEMSLSDMIAEYGMTDADLAEFLDDAKGMMDKGMTLYDILDNLEANMDTTRSELVSILLAAGSGSDGGGSSGTEDVEIDEETQEEITESLPATYSTGKTEDGSMEESDDVVSSSYASTDVKGN